MIWLFVPGIAPLQYVTTAVSDDRLATETHKGYDREISTLYNKNADSLWGIQVTELVSVWVKVEQDGYGLPVSSNPSTHIIWGVLSIYIAWNVSRVLATAVVGFTMLQAAGTMIFMQHYLIDLPLGVLVTMCSLYLARRLSTSLHDENLLFWFSPTPLKFDGDAA